MKRNYPFEGILQNGKRIQFNYYYEVLHVLWGFDYDYNDDKIILSTNNASCDIVLVGCKDNGDISGVFVDEEYAFLPVKGKVVVDIGANVGDTAIYFAIKGAEKIIALEPYPKNFEIAKKNILLNNLPHKIDLKMLACSSKNGFIDVSKENKVEKVPMITLENIVISNKIESAVLKIDCEGGEYDIILTASNETLRSFSHIQIEYHNGYKNLKEKLEKCGFKVSFTIPRFANHFYLNDTTLSLKSSNTSSNQIVINNEHNLKKMYIGMLYATLVNN